MIAGLGLRGEDGKMGSNERTYGGSGGYAGIHCWKSTEYTDNDINNDGKSDWNVGEASTLNISGSGTIICYGGDASDGGAAASSSTAQSQSGCGRWWWRRSRCWNWAEMEEKGGDSNSICVTSGSNGYNNAASITNDMNSGLDGGKGEDCGNVKISNSIIVYAFGGGGGSSPTSLNYGTNSGAGGYPAAGIGGGGAGGRRRRLGFWCWGIYRLCWR